MGLEKKSLAPLICAALTQPELEVKELKFESLASVVIVMPEIGEAELDRDPAAKSKFAKVAAWADEKPKKTARLSLLNKVGIIGGCDFGDARANTVSRRLAIRMMLERTTFSPEFPPEDWRLNL